MASITKIDYNTWERREIYEMFRGTTIYTTVRMDITEFLTRVKGQGVRFYPAMMHCLLRVVNGNPEFRYGYDENKEIGIWDVYHVMYTLPRLGKSSLFSMMVTEYDADFDVFYERFLADYDRAERCGRLLCHTENYPNIMGVTSMPDVHFSSFTFGSEMKPDFTPFVVLGKYVREGERIVLPVCGEFAHAVNDGFHVSLFFRELEAAMKDWRSERYI